MKSRWTLIGLMAWAIVAPALVVVMRPETARAATLSSLPLNQQAIVWGELQMLTHCTMNSSFGQDDFDSGRWFNGTVSAGHQVTNSNTDGNMDCNNENNWFTNLASTAGISLSQLATQAGMTKNATGNWGQIDANRVKDVLAGLLGNTGAAPAAVTYAIALGNFVRACYGDTSNAGSATANIWVSSSTTAVKYTYESGAGAIDIGYNSGIPGGNDGRVECTTLATYLSSDAAKAASQVAGAATVPATNTAANAAAAAANGNGGNTADPDTAVKCDAGKGFTWLICGTIEWALNVIDWIRNTVLIPMLQQKPFDEASPDIKALKSVWAGMRNIASIVLILLFLLIIFGTAIGYDNYTIKKTLPRLVAGAILMPLSWYICVFLVDLGNILGVGLKDLTAPFIPTPVIDFNSPISEAVYSVGGGILLGVTGFTAYTGMLWPVLLGMVFGLAAAFLTLVLRNILILVLTAVSPLAMLAYILPNTKKFYDMWQSNFLRLILMFPLIILLFQAGRLFAAIAGAGTNPIARIFALVGLTLPLFLVPATFKTAGRALSFGQNYIDKARGVANKQVAGRWGNALKGNYESRKALRQHNATQRAKDIDKETPTSLGGKLSKNVRHRTAMKMAGHGGFFGGKGNVLQQQKFESAYSEAAATQGKIEAAKLAGDTGTGETHKQRIEAETAMALKGITDGRANRAGFMQAVGEADGAELPDKMVSFARASYDAGTESSRKSNAKLLGTGTGVQAAAAAGGLASTGAIVADARKAQIDSLSDEKGQVEGRLTGQRHLENVELQDMGIANPALATDAQRATARARIQRYRQTDARVQARDAVLDEGGKKLQSQADFNTNRYQAAGEIVGSAALEQRSKLSTTRQVRRQRVAIQGTAEGGMSDADIEMAASREARESIGAQVMKQRVGNETERADLASGDATRRPTLTNSLIAARGRAEESASAESAQRTAYVRSALGYESEKPSRPSLEERIQDASFKATTDQRTKDLSVGERLSEISKAEDRVLLSQKIDPATASAGQRADARASISGKIAIQGSGEAGYKMRMDIAKARGEVEGFEKGVKQLQIEETAKNLREKAIDAHLAANTGATRAEAEEAVDSNPANDFKREAEHNVEALAAGAPAHPDTVTSDQASRMYHDAGAESAYTSAAQAQANSIGQAVGKGQSVTAAVANRAATNLLELARAHGAARGIKDNDDEAMKSFLNEQVRLTGAGTGNPTADRERARQALLTQMAAQAQSEVISAATLAGIDSGVRSEAAAQGTLISQEESYNSPTKSSAAQQLEMARRDTSSSAAAKEADQSVRLTQPAKKYGEMVGTARRAASEKQFETLISEAGRSLFLDPSSGMEVPISTLKPNSGNRDQIFTAAKDAFDSGDYARYTALTTALGLTTSGAERVRELLKVTFGTDGNVRIDPTIASKLEANARAAGDQEFSSNSLFQRVVSGINADKRPDIVKGPAAAFEKAKAGEVAAMDYVTKEHLFDYALAPVTVPPTDPKYAEKVTDREVLISESASNIKQIMTKGNINPKQTPSDYAAMYKFLYETSKTDPLGKPRKEAMEKFEAQFGSDKGAMAKAIEEITIGYKSENNLP